MASTEAFSSTVLFRIHTITHIISWMLPSTTTFCIGLFKAFSRAITELYCLLKGTSAAHNLSSLESRKCSCSFQFPHFLLSLTRWWIQTSKAGYNKNRVERMTQTSIISSCVHSKVGHNKPCFPKDIFVLWYLKTDDLVFYAERETQRFLHHSQKVQINFKNTFCVFLCISRYQDHPAVIPLHLILKCQTTFEVMYVWIQASSTGTKGTVQIENNPDIVWSLW